VVAFFGLFQHHEVFIEFLLFGERDGVHAGQLLAFFIAAPVSSGEVEDFHRFDGFCAGDVRAFAEVGEIALLVKGDLSILQAIDQFEFVLVAFFGEVLDGIGFGDFCTRTRFSNAPVRALFAQWRANRQRSAACRQSRCRSKNRFQWRVRYRIWYRGASASMASASKCAEECQKVCLPSLSSHLWNVMAASESIGRLKSRTSPLTEAASTTRARPSLMLFATSKALTFRRHTDECCRREM
jgi:hypothetical protein